MHVLYASSIDDEVSARVAKASAAFGRLMKHLWNDHGIRLSTKIAAYQAIVLTTLLYGCEYCTPYRRQIAKIYQFNRRCLRKIAHIKWQDLIEKTTVLERCQISGIETCLLAAQFRKNGKCKQQSKISYGVHWTVTWYSDCMGIVIMSWRLPSVLWLAVFAMHLSSYLLPIQSTLRDHQSADHCVLYTWQ